MHLLDLYLSTPTLYLSWWLLGLALLMVQQETGPLRLQFAHRQLLGLIAIILALGEGLEWAGMILSGYWGEQLIFYQQQGGWGFLLFTTLEIILIFTPLANLRLSWRRNEKVQQGLFALIGLYLALSLWFYGLPQTDWATSVIPGWHTTIFGRLGLEFTPVFILAMLFMSWGLKSFQKNMH